MTKQKTTEEQKRICREEWFKDHKAQLVLDRPEVKVIYWQNPASWNYGCRFLIHRRWLIVIGDIGEATYEWGQDLTLDFLASINLHYFLSKCAASEVGKDFVMWDSAVAYENAQSILADMDSEDHPGETDDPARAPIRSITANEGKDEFEGYVREAYNGGLEAEICSSLMHGGRVPNCRGVGHFVGLQMAIAQLKNVGPQI